MLKRIFLTVPMLFFSSIPLFGQIAMKLEMNRAAYLQYERIFARLTLRNDSGQIIVFGKDPKLNGVIHFEFTDHLNKKYSDFARIYALFDSFLKDQRLYSPTDFASTLSTNQEFLDLFARVFLFPIFHS